MQKKKRVFRAWLYTPQTGRETAVVQEFVLVGWGFFLFKTIPFTVLRNDSSFKQVYLEGSVSRSSGRISLSVA